METHLRNRKEAGEKLAEQLAYLKDRVVVYALPRGGVIVASEIAKKLNAPLDLIITRKIGHPFSPEYAIGAIAEDGHSIFHRERIADANQDFLISEAEKEKQEVKRRRQIYLGGRKQINSEGKIALVVDDGVATGLTIKLAIKELQIHYKPQKIIVAVGVISAQVAEELEKEEIEVIALIRDSEFLGSVGLYYDDFSTVEDIDVIKIMRSTIKYEPIYVSAI